MGQLRVFQLAEKGIIVDSVPDEPDVESPYDRDLHRMEEIYLAGRGGFWIARAGELPVGHIGGQDMGVHIELRRMYVRSAYRRRGIGALLVHTLITACRHQGVAAIKLWTNIDGPGQSLYARLGFRHISADGEDTQAVNDPSDQIRMCLILNDSIAGQKDSSAGS